VMQSCEGIVTALLTEMARGPCAPPCLGMNDALALRQGTSVLACGPPTFSPTAAGEATPDFAVLLQRFFAALGETKEISTVSETDQSQPAGLPEGYLSLWRSIATSQSDSQDGTESTVGGKASTELATSSPSERTPANGKAASKARRTDTSEEQISLLNLAWALNPQTFLAYLQQARPEAGGRSAGESLPKESIAGVKGIVALASAEAPPDVSPHGVGAVATQAVNAWRAHLPLDQMPGAVAEEISVLPDVQAEGSVRAGSSAMLVGEGVRLDESEQAGSAGESDSTSLRVPRGTPDEASAERPALVGTTAEGLVDPSKRARPSRMLVGEGAALDQAKQAASAGESDSTSLRVPGGTPGEDSVERPALVGTTAEGPVDPSKRARPSRMLTGEGAALDQAKQAASAGESGSTSFRIPGETPGEASAERPALVGTTAEGLVDPPKRQEEHSASFDLVAERSLEDDSTAEHEGGTVSGLVHLAEPTAPHEPQPPSSAASPRAEAPAEATETPVVEDVGAMADRPMPPSGQGGRVDSGLESVPSGEQGLASSKVLDETALLRTGPAPELADKSQASEVGATDPSRENKGGLRQQEKRTSPPASQGITEDLPEIDPLIGSPSAQPRPLTEGAKEGMQIAQTPLPMDRGPKEAATRMATMIGHLVVVNENRAVVQLHPPELGQMSIRVTMEEGGISVEMLVEAQGVKSLVEAQLDHLRGALAEQGLDMATLSVEVDQQTEYRREPWLPRRTNRRARTSRSEPTGVGAVRSWQPRVLLSQDSTIEYWI